MKKIILIIVVALAFLLIGCSDNSTMSGCECTKESFEIEVVTYNDGGVVRTEVRHTLIGTENVGCTEEGRTQTSDTTYFEITCN